MMTATNVLMLSSNAFKVKSVKETIIKFENVSGIKKSSSKEQIKNGRDYFFGKI